jgi:hypothetical protein
MASEGELIHTIDKEGHVDAQHNHRSFFSVAQDVLKEAHCEAHRRLRDEIPKPSEPKADILPGFTKVTYVLSLTHPFSSFNLLPLFLLLSSFLLPHLLSPFFPPEGEQNGSDLRDFSGY